MEGMIKMWSIVNLKKLLIYSFMIVVGCPFAIQAQSNSDSNAFNSINEFVRGFYDWYVPKARADNPDPAWEIVLKSKKKLLSPQLAQALKEDLDAQAEFPGDIVGIDFDPFLNTQDPVKRYTIGNIAQEGKNYQIEIKGDRVGIKNKRPDLIAEVAKKDGSYVFVNFHYSKNQDLLTILARLKSKRKNIKK